MKRFENITAVITGGAGGIVEATVKRIIEEGVKVLITCLDEESLKKTPEEINSPNLPYTAADVTDEKQIKAYAQKAKEPLGNIDVISNNAGIEGEVKPLNEYHKVNEENIYGVYYRLRHIFHLMKKKGGSVIITSSVAEMTGTANVLPYMASEYANNGMMRSEALEGAPYKIRVNTINSSPFDKRMMHSLEEFFAPKEARAARKTLRKPYLWTAMQKTKKLRHWQCLWPVMKLVLLQEPLILLIAE